MGCSCRSGARHPHEVKASLQCHISSLEGLRTLVAAEQNCFLNYKCIRRQCIDVSFISDYISGEMQFLLVQIIGEVRNEFNEMCCKRLEWVDRHYN